MATPAAGPKRAERDTRLAIPVEDGVVGFSYVVADTAGLIPVEVEIAVLPALMGAVFLIAFVIGNIRYR